MRSHASVEPIGAKICTWSRVGYVIICAILLKSAQIISGLRHFLYLTFIALKTVSALPCWTVMTIQRSYRPHYSLCPSVFLPVCPV